MRAGMIGTEVTITSDSDVLLKSKGTSVVCSISGGLGYMECSDGSPAACTTLVSRPHGWRKHLVGWVKLIYIIRKQTRAGDLGVDRRRPLVCRHDRRHHRGLH